VRQCGILWLGQHPAELAPLDEHGRIDGIRPRDGEQGGQRLVAEGVEHDVLARAGGGLGWIHVHLEQTDRRHPGERVHLGPEVAPRQQQLFGACVVGEHGAVDDDQRATTEERRQLGNRREAQHPQARGDRPIETLGPGPPRAQHRRRRGEIPQQEPGVHIRDRDQLQFDADHDAEAAAPAAQRPEQLVVRVGCGMDQLAGRRDDLEGSDPVRGESVHPAVERQSAAEHVARDRHITGAAVQGGEPVRRGRDHHVPPQRAAGHPGSTLLGIDLDARQTVQAQ
jgi:hypothetical protein